MTLARFRPLSLLLGMMLLVLPLLAEHGHTHADRAAANDNCPACQFLSVHQAASTGATPLLAVLPQPSPVSLPNDVLPCQDSVLFFHDPRGPPLSS